MSKGIGILGGTFDPIHYGHLRSAYEVLQQFELGHIHLIPSARPPHREQPAASPEERTMMLHLAVKGNPHFIVDDRELKREGLSYTIDTLESFKQESPSTPLFLIMGSDAFQHIDTWHRWQALLDHCHIVLLQRPDQTLSLSDEVQAWYQSHLGQDDDRTKPAGHIWPMVPTQLSISATEIRAALKRGERPYFLTSDTVVTLIEQLNLYQ